MKRVLFLEMRTRQQLAVIQLRVRISHALVAFKVLVKRVLRSLDVAHLSLIVGIELIEFIQITF